MVAFEWSPTLGRLYRISWKSCTWLENRNGRQNDIARWSPYVHIFKEEKYANKTQTFEHSAKRLNCFRLNDATRSITGADTEKLTYLGLNLLMNGWKSAMSQAASRRPFTVEANPCGNCGKQSGNEQIFFFVCTLVFPCQDHSSNATNTYFIHLPQTAYIFSDRQRR